MVTIDYNKIRNNILNLKKNNDLILVVKDNAYGFGIKPVVKIAQELNIHKFAVKSIEEGILVRKLDRMALVLILGKLKKVHFNTLKVYNLTPTINDYDDYIFYKENKIACHLEIDLGMNRFGMKNNYLAIINDSIVKAIYGHIYNDNYTNINKIKKIANNYLKDYHVGGSCVINKVEGTIRVGKAIYEHCLAFKGRIVNIKSLEEKETVGYDGHYTARNNCLIGVCDIGYSNGLKLFFHGRVFINDNYYQCVGKCCMDQCFILIDDKVKIGDEVEFFGDKINEDEFIVQNSMSKYEMFLQINNQAILT